MFVKYVGGKEGGLEKLKGKKIGLVYLDAPYGKEPIPLLEALAKDYGFELKLYPVPASEMQNQSSLWLNVRRDRPDWIYMQGFGAMNPTAVKEAINGDAMRRGLETLVITAARLKEIGADGFAGPMKVSCQDHNGHNPAFVAQWDGTKYTKASDWIEPLKDKVNPLIESASKEYVGANAGWPKRSEACDKSS